MCSRIPLPIITDDIRANCIIEEINKVTNEINIDQDINLMQTNHLLYAIARLITKNLQIK